MGERNYTYEIVDLAVNFHNFKHRTLKLDELKNATYDPRNQDYYTSIGLFAAWPIAALLAVLVIYFITSICMCCCCSSNKKRDGIKVQYKVLIFLFGLICGLSFIAGLYGDWKFHTGIKTVQNTTDDYVDLFDQISDNTVRVFYELDQINTNVKDLENTLKKAQADYPPIKDKLDDPIKSCQRIVDSFISTGNKLRDANTSISRANIDFVPDYVEYYGNVFQITVLCFLLVLAIIGLVFTVAICSRCLLGCFTVLAVLALIICSLLVAVTLPTAVGLSDFCLEAKPFARSLIPDKQVADYAIDCVKENIVYNSLKAATIEINQAKNEHKIFGDLLEQIKDYPGAIDLIKPKVDKLDQRFKEIDDIMATYFRLSDCKRIYDDINDSLSAVCLDGLKGVIMIFFNTIVSSVCFTVLIFGATFALR